MNQKIIFDGEYNNDLIINSLVYEVESLYQFGFMDNEHRDYWIGIIKDLDAGY